MVQKVKALSLLLFVLLTASLKAGQPSLIIGGDMAYPPYEYINSQGRATGYNVELSQLIAAELGMKPVFKLGIWSRVREELQNGNIHLIQGMAFSAERARTLYFSDPHTSTWRSVFVRKDSDLQSLQQLRGTTILVQEGDIALDFLRDVDLGAKIVMVPNQDNALHMLGAGRADAAILNYMQGMFQSKNHRLHNIRAMGPRIQPRFYCMASTDPELIKRVNVAINKLQATGELEALQEKWFGQYSPEMISLNRRYQSFVAYQLIFWIGLGLLNIGLLIYLVRIRRRLNRKTEECDDLCARCSQLALDQEIFSKSPVVSYKHLIDPYRLLYVSDGLKAWGYDPQKAMGREEGFDDIVLAEDRPILDFSRKKQIERREESVVNQYRILTKDGQIRWVMDQNVILYPEDSEIVVYGYMIDITEQKDLEAELVEAREKAESANLAKGQFLATMSHEVRTPLNGILGFVQVLMQTKSTPEQREYYSIIYKSGQNLLKIVNDVLDVSKIESGKMELVVSAFDPGFLVKDLVKSFASQREKPEVDIRATIRGKLPELVKGDMLRLRQVFINLMQNAIKYTAAGYIEVSAEVYNYSPDLVRILFCVQDTGIGIALQKQQDIFDNFTQVDNQLTRKYGGTGLGLSIVKRLVEMMGGFIWVESEPSKGASFFFIIPFHKSDELPQSTQAEPPSAPERDRKLPPMHVLLVEDEVINQAATKRQLERWGARVTIASNGAEAVGLYQQMDFDCILMDIQMPVMDGVTATRKIRELEKESHGHIKIFAYTALAMLGDKERFMEAGMDDYVSKPVDLEHLFDLLASVKLPPENA